ncbi:hypothetical protein [Brumicola blandensis]|uniref:HNH domain-containing protein n=1 Tax=Brumicola blandensis TaxID=3075611 RepID=A0AAW8R323_9ALTE|nr:hypothetical protein [Alteromonas sp. W409]MDT0583818.1 hypothetical protein [Alteromonas sp. W409]
MENRSRSQTRKYPRRSSLGECPLCHRRTHLTFHHLIPKKMHRRNYFKKHYSKAELAQGIDICRQCHNGLHRRFSEMELAKHLNSLSLIQDNPELTEYFEWVAKQKIQVG